MFVKIVRLNAIRIGFRDLVLPDYFIKFKSIICFDNLNNNLCFWFCIAYYYGKRRDRCTQLAKELFKEYVLNSYSINEYQGYNINDIKKYEDFKKH